MQNLKTMKKISQRWWANVLNESPSSFSIQTSAGSVIIATRREVPFLPKKSLKFPRKSAGKGGRCDG
jgi:hypothetical protein